MIYLIAVVIIVLVLILFFVLSKKDDCEPCNEPVIYRGTRKKNYKKSSVIHLFDEPRTVWQATKMCKIPKSTLRRYCHQMVKDGMLKKEIKMKGEKEIHLYSKK